MTKMFNEKVVLVTGAGAGLGRASVIKFAEAGAKTIVSDINAEAGEETVQLIQRRGGESTFITADVSKESDVENLIGQVVAEFGRLDCAHNNAGIFYGGPMVDISEKQWDTLMSINLKGIWLCMKHELRWMVKQQNGIIVNTSSVAGLLGAPNSSLYGASKWGVNGLTKSAAIEYARAGIRVNAVCPAGMKNTTMWLNTLEQDPELSAKLTEAVPLGRDTSPEEVASVVVWLCSEAAQFITGVTLPVDGGMSSI